MWKDSPRTVRKVADWLMLPGAVLGVFGVGYTVVMVAGVLLMIAGLIIHFAYYRCPHCRRFLDRSTGAYCPHCGKKME